MVPVVGQSGALAGPPQHRKELVVAVHLPAGPNLVWVVTQQHWFFLRWPGLDPQLSVQLERSVMGSHWKLVVSVQGTAPASSTTLQGGEGWLRAGAATGRPQVTPGGLRPEPQGRHSTPLAPV